MCFEKAVALQIWADKHNLLQFHKVLSNSIELQRIVKKETHMGTGLKQWLYGLLTMYGPSLWSSIIRYWVTVLDSIPRAFPLTVTYFGAVTQVS